MGLLCSHSNQQVTLNSMISIELFKNKCSDSHVCLGLFDDVPNFRFIHFISIRHLFKSVCKFVTWLLCTYLKRRFTSTEHRKPNKNCWNFLILSIYKCQIIFLIRNKTVFKLFGISGSSVPIRTLCICPALVQESSSASILSYICTDQR